MIEIKIIVEFNLIFLLYFSKERYFYIISFLIDINDMIY